MTVFSTSYKDNLWMKLNFVQQKYVFLFLIIMLVLAHISVEIPPRVPDWKALIYGPCSTQRKGNLL